MATLKIKDGGVAKRVSLFSLQDVKALNDLINAVERSNIGRIEWFGTKEVPPTYLLCDGRELDIVGNEELYDAIGDLYGPASSPDKFKIPDLIDRVAWGSAAAGTYKAAGIPDIIGEFNAGPAGNSGWNQIVGNAFAFNQGIGGSYRGTAVRQNYANAASANTSTSNSNWTRFRASSGEVPSTTSTTPANNVYGKSATVQPPALTLLPCIKASVYDRMSIVHTFAGRKIYRHQTRPGSVIEYNEFGSVRKLFVVDAAYRGVAKCKTKLTLTDGLTPWNHYYVPTCEGNVLDSEDKYTNLMNVSDITPYERWFTDDWFQAALSATLAPVIKTAKEATDAMIADGSCPAAQFCRNQSVGIELSLPNIYQSLVIFACGDIIDSLDPTLETVPKMALGMYTNSYRMFLNGNGGLWSSTETGADSGNLAYTSGRTRHMLKNYDLGVVPVAELA